MPDERTQLEFIRDSLAHARTCGLSRVRTETYIDHVTYLLRVVDELANVIVCQGDRCPPGRDYCLIDCRDCWLEWLDGVLSDEDNRDEQRVAE